MKLKTKTTPTIDHKVKEGYHIFTSTEIKGLYVASKDYGKALRSLPEIIKKLVKYNKESVRGKHYDSEDERSA